MTLPEATLSGPTLGFTLPSLWEMTKPRVTRLVLVTTALGGVMAPGPIELSRLVFTVVGTLLVVAAANVLNMFLEQESDALMDRTRERPLPAGRVSSEVALAFGIALAMLGSYVLAQFVNTLTCELALMAFVSYVLVYTPLKAVSQVALYVGAVPGAMPPLLGYAGQHGELTLAAWSVFLVLFAWQLPHFLAIAIFRRNDYSNASLAVMPVVSGLPATERAIVALAALLALVSVLPWYFAVGGTVYLVTALASSGAFLAFAAFGRRRYSVDAWAKRVFFASMPHLVVLYAVLAVSAP